MQSCGCLSCTLLIAELVQSESRQHAPKSEGEERWDQKHSQSGQDDIETGNDPHDPRDNSHIGGQLAEDPF